MADASEERCYSTTSWLLKPHAGMPVLRAHAAGREAAPAAAGGPLGARAASAAAMRSAESVPGALVMDGGARVAAAEEQRLTGHRGALLCLAAARDGRLFSASTDLSIKVRTSGSSLHC